jgi:CRISPR-associated protein Cst1
VGLAALCAISNRTEPSQLRRKDLDKAAQLMSEYYFSGLMNSYLTCVFMNSAYVQPAMKPKEQKEYEKRVLYAHHWPGDEAANGLFCSFSKEPATHLIHRGQMPMLTGEEVLNFFPHGQGGLPVSGPYLVALQALPLGSRRTEGRLLSVYCDDHSILMALAKKYVADNQRLMELSISKKLPNADGPFAELSREQAAFDKKKKKPKYPDAKAPTSLIAADLTDVLLHAQNRPSSQSFVSITAYWLSNSGQGPSLEIFHVPSQAIRFLVMAASATTSVGWKRLIAQSWLQPEEKAVNEEEQPAKRAKKEKPKKGIPGGAGRSRNLVLADLFAVFEHGFIDLSAARYFIQRHLLRLAKSRYRKALSGEKTVESKAGIDRPDWIDWALTGFFVKELLGMEEQRLTAIREFADKISAYIDRVNDRDLFLSFIYGSKQWEIRNALTKAQRNRAREHNDLLFGLDEYVKVFVADDAVGKFDWGLTRDLISIRIVEQLFHKKFFDKTGNQELLVEPQTETAALQ